MAGSPNTIDAGPVTRTAVIDVPRIGNQGLEVHLSNGEPSLGPASAPYVSAQVSNYNIYGAPIAAVNTVTAAVIFVSPA